jgi:hypothetical protein
MKRIPKKATSKEQHLVCSNGHKFPYSKAVLDNPMTSTFKLSCPVCGEPIPQPSKRGADSSTLDS